MIDAREVARDTRGRQATAGAHRLAGSCSELWAVVLAGGQGTRLRGFLREVLGQEHPKQFCRIVGSRSMLRHAWDRAARVVEPERILTVITVGQEPFLVEEARRGVPGNVLVQPANKETAPALLLALLWIARLAPSSTVAVFPADHFVWEEDRFAAHIRDAIAAAQDWPDRVILLGVEADSAEVGYGWIAPGERLPAGLASELLTVRRFWEKPDARTAARLFAHGYLWNTLVCVGHLEAYLRLAEAAVPQVPMTLRNVQPWLGTPREASALDQAYQGLVPTNLSRDILARHPGRLLVLAARGVSWSDWGEADRIVRTLRRYNRRPKWLQAYAA